MKSIRKIAGKVTALAVAITTSVALLSPYDAQAGSGATVGGGSATKCGWTPISTECSQYVVTSKGGSGGGWASWVNKTFGLEGSGSTSVTKVTMWKTICDKGSARACSFSDPCAEYSMTYVCNPDCTVRIY